MNGAVEEWGWYGRNINVKITYRIIEMVRSNPNKIIKDEKTIEINEV